MIYKGGVKITVLCLSKMLMKYGKHHQQEKAAFNEGNLYASLK